METETCFPSPKMSKFVGFLSSSSSQQHEKQSSRSHQNLATESKRLLCLALHHLTVFLLPKEQVSFFKTLLCSDIPKSFCPQNQVLITESYLILNVLPAVHTALSLIFLDSLIEFRCCCFERLWTKASFAAFFLFNLCVIKRAFY